MASRLSLILNHSLATDGIYRRVLRTPYVPSVFVFPCTKMISGEQVKRKGRLNAN